MKDRGKQSLYASGEDYLEAILVLKKQKGMVRSVDVARHLEVTKPMNDYNKITALYAIQHIRYAIQDRVYR